MGHYEKLMSAVPVNSNAANAIKGGISFDESGVAKIPDHSGFWDVPPAIIGAEKVRHMMRNAEFIDFTGVRVGRITVMGIPDIPRDKTRTRWLVRCDCGLYETRRSRTLKLARHDEKCFRCDKIEKMKNDNSSIVGKALIP